MRYASLVLIGFAVGCGGPKTVPVSGTVSLDGKPLAHASVTFEPIHGQATMTSVATTDAEGRFELTTVAGTPGALVGDHRVIISTSFATNGDERTQLPPEQVPLEYQDGSVTFEVTERGHDDANFTIKRRRARS